MTIPNAATNVTNKTKSRPRERTTAKAKPATKTITLFIIRGPERSELYCESEFCLDGNSGPIFRSKFRVRENAYTLDTLHACITGIQHQPNSTHEFKLSGDINIAMTNTKHSSIYPFTATYDAKFHSGTIRIKIPLADLS